MTDPDGADTDPLEDPRVQAGVEHLQRAAHEVIAASRALLDVAEELVDDPGALRGLLDVVGTMGERLGRQAARVTRLPVDGPDADLDADDWDGWDGDLGGDDGRDDPPVQRIPIS